MKDTSSLSRGCGKGKVTSTPSMGSSTPVFQRRGEIVDAAAVCSNCTSQLPWSKSSSSDETQTSPCSPWMSLWYKNLIRTTSVGSMAFPGLHIGSISKAPSVSQCSAQWKQVSRLKPWPDAICTTSAHRTHAPRGTMVQTPCQKRSKCSPFIPCA